MKYKFTNKIKGFSAINNYHGLGKENAKALESGKIVELKTPPEKLIKGGYITKVKEKKNGN